MRTVASLASAVVLAAGAISPANSLDYDAAKRACKADALNLCLSSINIFHPDYNKIGACLYAHREQLSPDCANQMKNWKPKGK